MTLSQFWRERQAEFERYQQKFRALKWNWVPSGQFWWPQYGESREGILNPPRQAVRVFQAITITIVAGCTDIRTEIASKPYPRVADAAEPWELWLDFMRVREWGFVVTGPQIRCNEYEWDAGVKDGKAIDVVRKELKLRRPTWDEDRDLYRRLPNGSLKRLSKMEHKDNENIQKYYHWFEGDGVIEHVFESSALFSEELAAQAFESETAASGADARANEKGKAVAARHSTERPGRVGVDDLKKRAKLLKDEMRQRKWRTSHDVACETGLDYATVQRILDAKYVKPSTIDKIRNTLPNFS
jgi:hypothetical protein